MTPTTLLISVLVITATLTSRVRATDEQDVSHHRVRRVIGGRDVEGGQWPWLVSLQGKVPNRMFLGIPLSYQKFYCGASLISDRWLLTAAHCFTENKLGTIALTPKYWHARLGQISLKRGHMERVKDFLGKVLDRRDMRHYHLHAEKIVVHPNYHHDNMWENDIALIKMEEAVPDSADVRPHIQSIHLANENNLTFPQDGQVCVMKGWGCLENGGSAAPTARQVSMPKLNDDECRRLWGVTTTGRMCAGYMAGGSLGICSGDSGGPLVCSNGEEWIQVGVASFTSASRPDTVPGVFTRVAHYRAWINDVINSSSDEE